MNSAELTGTVWRKSSRSNGQANCVEIAFLGTSVAMRDSKDRGSGPILRFSQDEWTAFVAGVEVCSSSAKLGDECEGGLVACSS
jgi:hypothetical protein